MQDEPLNGPLLPAAPTTPIKTDQNNENVEPSTPVMDEPNDLIFPVPSNSKEPGKMDAISGMQPNPRETQGGEQQSNVENVDAFADPGTPTMDEPMYDSGFSAYDGGAQSATSTTDQYSDDPLAKVEEPKTDALQNVESSPKESESEVNFAANGKSKTVEQNIKVEKSETFHGIFDKAVDLLVPLQAKAAHCNVDPMGDEKRNSNRHRWERDSNGHR